MTMLAAPPTPPTAAPSALVEHGLLPRWAPAAIGGAALVAAAAIVLVIGFSVPGLIVIAAILYAVGTFAISRRVEGRRKSTDRLVTTVVTGAFALALVPLVSVSWTVVQNGLPGLSSGFLVNDMRGVIGEGGGAFHAIVGTLLITGFAAVISVPVGLLAAIYLIEYGTGRLARAITFFVDVMTGIPSIVAGLFAYALFALFFGPGVRLGAAGSVALTLLMTPVVVRSCEEMLKLVPNELREASYALGVPKWRTIVKIVLPTAIAGIATGITLAIARVIGETAPLLIAAGFTQSTNWDLFHGRMTTLPVLAFYSFTQPGFPPEAGIQRAWAAALILILIVMALNLLARLISRIFAPEVVR